jgi:hypothetical protein
MHRHMKATRQRSSGSRADTTPATPAVFVVNAEIAVRRSLESLIHARFV